MIATNQIINDKITKFFFQLNQMTENKGSNILIEREFKEEIENQELLARNYDDKILDSKLEQIFLVLLQKKLQTDVKLNQLFTQKIDNQLIKNFVSNARLHELKTVKVLRKGKSYYINELLNTYYGKVILKGIESISPHRRSLNKEEYELVKEQCLRIKLELPEIIEPTRSEIFFNNDITEE